MAQVYAEAAPKGVAHPVGEGDRSGEGEAGGGFGEGLLRFQIILVK